MRDGANASVFPTEPCATGHNRFTRPSVEPRRGCVKKPASYTYEDDYERYTIHHHSFNVQVVLEHFELCRKFWKMHNGRLDQWSQQVKDGKVPDFGANLVY